MAGTSASPLLCITNNLITEYIWVGGWGGGGFGGGENPTAPASWNLCNNGVPLQLYLF